MFYQLFGHHLAHEVNYHGSHPFISHGSYPFIPLFLLISFGKFMTPLPFFILLSLLSNFLFVLTPLILHSLQKSYGV